MAISHLTAPAPQQPPPCRPASRQQATLDPLGPVYLYQQLAAILRDQIRSGELPPGSPVPPLPKLTKQYKIANRTARQALAVLEDEHLVRVIPGRGTYVLAQSPG
jgi:GntR family transcriptional regulator